MFRPSDSSVLAIFIKIYFSSAVITLEPESVISQTLFESVWALKPMQLPTLKILFMGKIIYFFFGLPDLVGD